MMEQEFNVIKSKEIKSVSGYLHSKNEDGTFNVCFNFNTISPKPRHMHRYTAEYLDKYYKMEGTVKWSLD